MSPAGATIDRIAFLDHAPLMTLLLGLALLVPLGIAFRFGARAVRGWRELHAWLERPVRLL